MPLPGGAVGDGPSGGPGGWESGSTGVACWCDSPRSLWTASGGESDAGLFRFARALAVPLACWRRWSAVAGSPEASFEEPDPMLRK